jgi:hypothetical protein
MYITYKYIPTYMHVNIGSLIIQDFSSGYAASAAAGVKAAPQGKRRESSGNSKSHPWLSTQRRCPLPQPSPL